MGTVLCKVTARDEYTDIKMDGIEQELPKPLQICLKIAAVLLLGLLINGAKISTLLDWIEQKLPKPLPKGLKIAAVFLLGLLINGANIMLTFGLDRTRAAKGFIKRFENNSRVLLGL